MLDHLTTEQRNPLSEAIDSMSALEIVDLMSRQDALVAEAVAQESAHIANGVEAIVRAMREGGRLFYLGAGTSGRLGVLDASECPPTFNTPPELVIGVIAGGPGALTRAVEGAEDHPEYAQRDLAEHAFAARDVLVGIATSGRTPYVLGGLRYARQLGAFTIGLSCNRDSDLNDVANLMITPVVGAEVVSGSTRLKAGTATKMVLNMLTTATMVRLGKTYGNLMVDLRATNLKLLERSRRIVNLLTGLDLTEAEQLLNNCQGDVKVAVVVHRRRVSPAQARQLLDQAAGHLRRALECD